MKTQFLTLKQKVELLNTGNHNAVNILLREISRLETIIKDYELGIDMLNEKYKSKSFKYPNSID